MKFFFDLLPVGSFLVALLIWDIFVATAVAIAVTVGQISWLALRKKKIHGMLWISAACVLVFGGLTLILQDKTFIQWKPTVVYWLFGSVLAIAPLLGKNLIKTMMSEQLRLPEKTWSRGRAAGRLAGVAALALAVAIIWFPWLAPGLHAAPAMTMTG